MRASYAVGVDVGGTRLAAGLVERKGRVIKEARRMTPENGPFAIVDAIIDAIQEVTGGAHPSEIAGIGIGLPAQIDFQRQTVEFCTNLPLAGVDVRSLVMSRVKFPVTLDNDGQAAAIGESRYGASRGVRDFIMLTVGTGVGGGLFIGGEPYRGFRGLGGEVGHVLVDIDGPPCPCGSSGHLEALVAGPPIARRGKELAGTFKGMEVKRLANDDIEAVTSETVVAAAENGDEAAAAILEEAATIFGRTLVGFVNLFNPQLIVIGGGLGECCPVFVQKAEEIVQSDALAGRRDVKIVRAELGNDAGVLGAAVLAFDEYDSRESLHR